MLIFIAIGFISALMSATSGAGAALFATPLLLSIGIPLPVILSSNQLSAALWTPIASRNYISDFKFDFKLVLGISLIGMFGVWFGYRSVIYLPVAELRRIIGIIILLIIIVVYFKKSLLESGTSSSKSRVLTFILGFPLGAYQAVFGSGNTLFSSICFCRFYGFNFKQALAHSYAVAFFWCSLAAVLFFIQGWFDWNVALPTAGGSLVGAYLGSRFGNSLSTTNLRKVFLLFGGIMGVKLMLLG